MNKGHMMLHEHPKQVIKGEKLERTQSLIEQHKNIIYYVLLCPSYPNNGQEFTYEHGSIQEELPHNYSVFEHKIDQHLHQLHHISKSIGQPIEHGQIIIKPLVCEIEKDLPNVIEKFSGGSVDLFEAKIETISGLIGDSMSARYKDHGVDIQAGKFASISNLEDHQKYIDNKIENNQLPQDFIERAGIIAEQRSYMFENLYGASSLSQKTAIATRQMKNYLAVTLGISLQDPGCFVINAKTPNRYYVEHPLTHEIIDVSKEELALYTFLN